MFRDTFEKMTAADTTSATPPHTGEKPLATLHSTGASEMSQVLRLNQLDPEIAVIVAGLTPERRAEIEKKLKLKIDLILFPMLLIFYILNYIVSFP